MQQFSVMPQSQTSDMSRHEVWQRHIPRQLDAFISCHDFRTATEIWRGSVTGSQHVFHCRFHPWPLVVSAPDWVGYRGLAAGGMVRLSWAWQAGQLKGVDEPNVETVSSCALCLWLNTDSSQRRMQWLHLSVTCCSPSNQARWWTITPWVPPLRLSSALQLSDFNLWVLMQRWSHSALPSFWAAAAARVIFCHLLSVFTDFLLHGWKISSHHWI